MNNFKENVAVIDWETLGIDQTTKVLSLGITWFNLNDNNDLPQLISQSKSWNINILNQTGRTETQSTLDWWKKQNPKAWNAHREGELHNLNEVIYDLTQFIQLNKIKYLIGNGIGFDNVILKNICDQYKMPYPVEYWGDLDLRTMRWVTQLKKPPFPTGLTPHIAHHDTVAEAVEMIQYVSYLVGSKSQHK